MERTKQAKRKIEYKFRVSPELHDYINLYASERGLKKAEAIREICAQEFARFFKDNSILKVPRI